MGESAIRTTLREPYAPLVSLLAFNNSAAVINPAGKQGGGIGTGPYRIKEHKPDQYLQLVRHEHYAPLPGEAQFYGGARCSTRSASCRCPTPTPASPAR